jgi:myo-inositol-1(or 4)-monophosphatase
MPLPLDHYASVCEQAARAGGAVLLDWADRFAAREKAPRDLVTEADVASQDTIQAILEKAFPTHGFLGEEDAVVPSQSDDLQWVVDPLDGTANYVHRLPNYAVSIALEQRGEPLVGTVFDPVSRECFSAIKGGGAYLNGKRLGVSRTVSLSEALVANSFSASVRRGDRELAEFEEVMLTAQATRRMGSSALNLAYLAAGRFDAYWSRSTKVWDIAAGVLLATEAGGIVTGLDGSPLRLPDASFIAAATPNLHNELRQLLEHVGRPTAGQAAT